MQACVAELILYIAGGLFEFRRSGGAAFQFRRGQIPNMLQVAAGAKRRIGCGDCEESQRRYHRRPAPLRKVHLRRPGETAGLSPPKEGGFTSQTQSSPAF